MLQISGSVVDCSAFDANDGSISIAVGGGISPYSFLWSNGDTTSSITCAAGVYTVTVTDSASAVVQMSFTVGQPVSFNLDTRPFDTGLLSDTVVRDLYSRNLISDSQTLIGRGTVTQNLLIRETNSTYLNVGKIDSSMMTSGGSSINISVFDNTTPYDVLDITRDGVIINGNLTVQGSMTTVYVADIQVDDKTITLCANANSNADLNGAGIILGNEDISKTYLYNSTYDAIVHSSSLYLNETNSSIRIGNNWNTAPTVLSSDEFKVANTAGYITLDNTGLTLSNALLIDPIPTTTQIMSDYGILVRSNNKTFGWNGHSWSTSGDSINASYFTTNGGATFNTTGLNIPIPNSADTVSMTMDGFSIGSDVKLDSSGLDLQNNDSCIYFGNKKWRISYDTEENALSFSKLVNGVYVCKLFLD